MKILFVTSECAPFSKSGGLADVAFSLPPALKEAGHEIAVITPMYQCVKEKFGNELKKVLETTVRLGVTEAYCGLYRGENHGVTTWFVDNEDFFYRPKLYGYDDDKLRFAWFSRAVIELIDKLDFVPEILHCNDWETALAVIYLKNDQTWRQDLQNIKSVYTIHNIAYQGQFGASELTTTFALPEGWYDGGLGYEYEGRHDVNLMKGAMLMADAVSTVSPTYARELHQPQFGKGLEGVTDLVENKLYGILNGIDMAHYDPTLDTRIPFPFSADDTAGKAKCKASIQEKFGLAKEPHWPLLASVARLVAQKGIELIKEILPQLMDMGVQLIVFGQGEQQYIDYFNWAKQQWPGQLGFSSDYSEQMASEIFAGADMYLMPSSFEPCGLSQMMAMRYGTVPIVHETGGLKDSVRPYSDFDGIGDGFSFSNYQGKDLYLAIQEAVKIYFADEKTFAQLRRRCMEKDFSWTKSAEQYTRMYGEISDGCSGESVSYEDAFTQLKAAYEDIDQENRRKYAAQFSADYHRVIQFQMTGRASGTFYVEFTTDKILVMPSNYVGADAYVTASFDHLLGMAEGKVSADKLYISGQLKIAGNLSKGVEMRQLLGRPSGAC
ncbi:MAG: glycogen/starch synthase [Oscillospiraceae bacterium]|nr:glycogen/starch synthase [Oscillospiraceae bacterium]